MRPYQGIEAYALEAGQQVSCLFCRQEGWGWDDPTYVRGEAVLADAGHPPYDANANYVCLGHLVAEAVLFDPHADGGMHELTREEYEALGPNPAALWWRR